MTIEEEKNYCEMNVEVLRISHIKKVNGVRPTHHFVPLGVSLLQQPLCHSLLLPLGVMKEAIFQGIHHRLDVLLFFPHLLILLFLPLCHLFLLPPLLLLLLFLHDSGLLLQR